MRSIAEAISDGLGRAGFVLAVVMLALTASPLMAGEYYFTNSVGSQSYNAGGNWDLGAMPGGADNAHFTNNASYTVTWSASVSNTSAFFDAPGGVVTLNPGANTWRLGGTLNVGQDVAAAATVRLAGGTNVFQGIVLTNVTANGLGTSFLQLETGTLTTYGADIRMATNGLGDGVADFRVGFNTAGAGTMTWNVAGGLNKVQTYQKPNGTFNQENGNNVIIGGRDGGKSGVVNVSGTGTVFEVIGGAMNIGAQQQDPGGGMGGASNNRLTITDGARVYNTNTVTAVYLGWSSTGNVLTVSGANSLLNVRNIQVGKNAASGNQLVVTNGASAVVISAFGIEDGGKYSKIIVTGPNSSFRSAAGGVGGAPGGRSNELIVANGASFYNSGNMQFGKNHATAAWSYGNEIQVTGAGSTFTNAGTIYMEGSNQVFRVSAGGGGYWGGGSAGDVGGRIEVTDTNSALSLPVGNLTKSSSILVSNGAVLTVRSGGSFYIGTAGSAPTDRLASIRVTGSGSRLIATNSAPFRVAWDGDAQFIVDNGGQCDYTEAWGANWGLSIGYGAGRTGTFVVAGPGSLFRYSDNDNGAGNIRVGESCVGRLMVTNQGAFWANTDDAWTGLFTLRVGNTNAAAGSSALVADGGLLDLRAGGMLVGNFAGNSVSNVGGVFQFSAPTPKIEPGAYGNIVVNGGTISFRNIVNADVKGNWTGSLTNIFFQGNNTFRLNAATNVNAVSQAYTFATGLGATNYATLELLNGSMYRGGSVTIGSGGTLVVTGAVSAIGSNLTFQPGGTYRVVIGATNDYTSLTVGGAVALGNATVDIQLLAPPEKDYRYLVIRSTGASPVTGQFGSAFMTASYGGTNYEFTVRGQGNDVVAGWFSRGSVFILR